MMVRFGARTSSLRTATTGRQQRGEKTSRTPMFDIALAMLGISATRLPASYPGTRPALGIPVRRKGRADEALVLRQRRDGGPVLVVEPHVQRREIGALALGPLSLRDDDHAVLIEQPSERGLRARDAVLVADPPERRVGGGAPLRQRRVGCERDPAPAQVGQHRRLAEERVVLDLMRGDRRPDMSSIAERSIGMLKLHTPIARVRPPARRSIRVSITTPMSISAEGQWTM